MSLLDTLIFSKAVDCYITAKVSEGRSPRTTECYEYGLGKLSKYLGEVKLLEITPHHLRTFFANAHENKLSGHTIHQYFRVFRAFFRWCEREGFIEHNPMSNITAPKVPKRHVPVFSPGEIQDMLDLCKPKTFMGSRNRAILLFLVDTGIRASELISLTEKNIDPRTGIIKVIGKGDKERLLRIGATARRELWRYMLLRDIKLSEGERHIFLSEEMRPLTRSGLEQIIRRLGKQAEIQDVKCSPHTFRHTFAVSFLRQGGDIVNLQTILGHTSMEMSRQYLTSMSDDDAIRAHEKFSPGDAMGLK